MQTKILGQPGTDFDTESVAGFSEFRELVNRRDLYSEACLTVFEHDEVMPDSRCIRLVAHGFDADGNMTNRDGDIDRTKPYQGLTLDASRLEEGIFTWQFNLAQGLARTTYLIEVGEAGITKALIAKHDERAQCFELRELDQAEATGAARAMHQLARSQFSRNQQKAFYKKRESGYNAQYIAATTARKFHVEVSHGFDKETGEKVVEHLEGKVSDEMRKKMLDKAKETFEAAKLPAGWIDPIFKKFGQPKVEQPRFFI